jgi:hypothetical protein
MEWRSSTANNKKDVQGLKIKNTKVPHKNERPLETSESRNRKPRKRRMIELRI